MKKTHLLLTLMALALPAASFADVKAQAGEIHAGKEMKLTANSGIASYYANGRAGNVQFSCELKGNLNDACPKQVVYAVLRPGKNFNNVHNMPFTTLYPGENGPFNWTLTDTGESLGNIKVFYGCGDQVSVRCLAK